VLTASRLRPWLSDYAAHLPEEKKFIFIAIEHSEICGLFLAASDANARSKALLKAASVLNFLEPSRVPFVIECFTYALGWTEPMARVPQLPVEPKTLVPTSEQLSPKKAKTTEVPTKSVPNSVSVGSTMLFGNYNYQGKPLEWLVLAVETGKALLITKDCVTEKAYNEEWDSVTWEKCTLRKWLNGDFLNATFSNSEKAQIVVSTVKNDDNAKYGTPGGNDTRDQVFLLSLKEAERFFSKEAERFFSKDNSRRAKYKGKEAWWWLRSPGYNSYFAAIVLAGGSVNGHGLNVNNQTAAVRPALWLNL
jgi:hypothetical protein